MLPWLWPRGGEEHRLSLHPPCSHLIHVRYLAVVHLLSLARLPSCFPLPAVFRCPAGAPEDCPVRQHHQPGRVFLVIARRHACLPNPLLAMTIDLTPSKQCSSIAGTALLRQRLAHYCPHYRADYPSCCPHNSSAHPAGIKTQHFQTALCRHVLCTPHSLHRPPQCFCAVYRMAREPTVCLFLASSQPFGPHFFLARPLPCDSHHPVFKLLAARRVPPPSPSIYLHACLGNWRPLLPAWGRTALDFSRFPPLPMPTFLPRPPSNYQQFNSVPPSSIGKSCAAHFGSTTPSYSCTLAHSVSAAVIRSPPFPCNMPQFCYWQQHRSGCCPPRELRRRRRLALHAFADPQRVMADLHVAPCSSGSIGCKLRIARRDRERS